MVREKVRKAKKKTIKYLKTKKKEIENTIHDNILALFKNNERKMNLYYEVKSKKMKPMKVINIEH